VRLADGVALDTCRRDRDRHERLLVVRRGRGRIDPVSDKVDWGFETGLNGTHMVLAAPDGQTILMSNIGSNSVSIIRRATDGARTQTAVAVGKGPEGIDLSADGTTVWSAHSQDGGVSVIDLASAKVLHTMDVGTRRSNRIKLTPDGRFALISDLDAGDLVVIETTTRTVVKRLALGKMPEGILIPPRSAVAYVAVNGDNHVAVVDLKTWTVTTRLHTGAGPDGLAWTR
jgi:YVTN family beta-propeller protein